MRAPAAGPEAELARLLGAAAARRPRAATPGPLYDEARLRALAEPHAGGRPFERFYRDPVRHADWLSMARHSVGPVTWIAKPGTMYRVAPAYVSPKDDNLFDGEKLAAVERDVKARVPMTSYAPYAHAKRIDRGVISESIGLAARGELADAKRGRAFTAGHPMLDDYLRSIESWSGTVVPEMEAALAHAEALAWGDFGRFWITVRDGNHRLFGALLAGARWAWVTVPREYWEDAGEGFEAMLR